MIYLILLIAIGMGGYILYQKVEILSQMDKSFLNNIPFLSGKIIATNETVNWKTYKFSNDEISFKYPENWFKDDIDLISQYPYTKGQTNNVFNVIFLRKVDNQMHVGYINQEWFDVLYGLQINQMFKNEYHDIDKVKNILINKGLSTSGERYIVTRDEESGPLNAYFLSGNYLYQFSLNYYDDSGLIIFYKILKTVEVLK